MDDGLDDAWDEDGGDEYSSYGGEEGEDGVGLWEGGGVDCGGGGGGMAAVLSGLVETEDRLEDDAAADLCRVFAAFAARLALRAFGVRRAAEAAAVLVLQRACRRLVLAPRRVRAARAEVAARGRAAAQVQRVCRAGVARVRVGEVSKAAARAAALTAAAAAAAVAAAAAAAERAEELASAPPCSDAGLPSQSHRASALYSVDDDDDDNDDGTDDGTDSDGDGDDDVSALCLKTLQRDAEKPAARLDPLTHQAPSAQLPPAAPVAAAAVAAPSAGKIPVLAHTSGRAEAEAAAGLVKGLCFFRQEDVVHGVFHAAAPPPRHPDVTAVSSGYVVPRSRLGKPVRWSSAYEEHLYVAGDGWLRAPPLAFSFVDATERRLGGGEADGTPQQPSAGPGAGAAGSGAPATLPPELLEATAEVESDGVMAVVEELVAAPYGVYIASIRLEEGEGRTGGGGGAVLGLHIVTLTVRGRDGLFSPCRLTLPVEAYPAAAAEAAGVSPAVWQRVLKLKTRAPAAAAASPQPLAHAMPTPGTVEAALRVKRAVVREGVCFAAFLQACAGRRGGGGAGVAEWLPGLYKSYGGTVELPKEVSLPWVPVELRGGGGRRDGGTVAAAASLSGSVACGVRARYPLRALSRYEPTDFLPPSVGGGALLLPPLPHVGGCGAQSTGGKKGGGAGCGASQPPQPPWLPSGRRKLDKLQRMLVASVHSDNQPRGRTTRRERLDPL